MLQYTYTFMSLVQCSSHQQPTHPPHTAPHTCTDCTLSQRYNPNRPLPFSSPCLFYCLHTCAVLSNTLNAACTLGAGDKADELLLIAARRGHIIYKSATRQREAKGFRHSEGDLGANFSRNEYEDGWKGVDAGE